MIQEVGIRPNNGQSILARQLRQEVIQKWINQNKGKGCSQWKRQIQRLNLLYQTIDNQRLTSQQKIHKIMASFNYRLGKVSLQLNALQGNINTIDPRCLYHPSCLSPFIIKDINKYLNMTAQIVKQVQAQFREQGINNCSSEDGWKRYPEGYQTRKQSRKIQPKRNQPTKIVIDQNLSFQIPSIAKLDQKSSLTFQFDFIDSIKSAGLLSQYPPLITQEDHSLISLSMGCVRLKDKNLDVEIKQPIIVKTKAPRNMSKKQAQKFERFIYSFGDLRWNVTQGGLKYDDKLKEFSMQMQTAYSLGKDYIFKQVEKIANKYKKKIESIVNYIIQARMFLPSYNRQQLLDILNSFQQKKKTIKQDNIYFELSKVQGKPTYLPQKLRIFCKQTNGFREQQIELNIKTQIVKKLSIDKLQFHLCVPADMIAEALGIQLTKDEHELWNQLINLHNNDVIQEVYWQKDVNDKQKKQLQKKFESLLGNPKGLKYSSTITQDKQIKHFAQNDEESKIQLGKIIQYFNSLPKSSIKTSLNDQFIFKRVYIYDGRYQNILVSYLLKSLTEQRKKIIFLDLDKRKVLKKSLKGGSNIFDYKAYYSTYPNIFQFPEAQFQINPFIPQSQLDEFRQKLNQIKRFQQEQKRNIQTQNFELLQLYDQYKSTEKKLRSLLTQEEIKRLLQYKQQKIKMLRNKIASEMKKKFKEHQNRNNNELLQFPKGYKYCLNKLYEINQCLKQSEKISDDIMKGYRQSGLHSIFNNEDPGSLRSLANNIQNQVRLKLITQEQFLNCQLLMNQASGIDAFNGIDQICINIKQSFNHNKDKIDKYCQQVESFIKSQQFFKKSKIHNSFDNYTKVQLNIDDTIIKMKQIKSRVAAQFNYIANLTTFVYVNNDTRDYYRRLTIPQMNSKIYDHLSRFFVDIRKPILPNFSSRELENKAYQELNKQKQKLKQKLQQLSVQYKNKAKNSIYKIICPNNIVLVNSCTDIFHELQQRLQNAIDKVKAHEKQQLQKKEKINKINDKISNNFESMQKLDNQLIQPDLTEEQKNGLQLQYIKLEEQTKTLKQDKDEMEKCTHTTPPEIIVLQQQIKDLKAKQKQIQTLLNSQQNKLNKLYEQVFKSCDNYNCHVDRLQKSSTVYQSSGQRKYAIQSLQIFFRNCQNYEEQFDRIQISMQTAIHRLSLQTKQRSQRWVTTLNKVTGLFKRMEILLSTPYSFEKDIQQKSKRLSQQIIKDMEDIKNTEPKLKSLMYLSIFGQNEASEIMRRKTQIDNWIKNKIKIAVNKDESQLQRFEHQYNQLFRNKKYQYQQTILTTSQQFKQLVNKFVRQQI